MNYNFDAKKTKEELVQWIRDWFAKNGPQSHAVLGISGGKDSTVIAALCVEALGADRVMGVMMPNGVQKDITDSYRVVEHLGIKYVVININGAFTALKNEIEPKINGWSAQTNINLPPRLRTATLYAIGQTNNAMVLNCSNFSEACTGYGTLFGDTVGSLSPLGKLTVTEVKAIGHELNLPHELVEKAPADGLTGNTDEDSLGFTYAVLDKFIRTGVCDDEEVKKAILRKYKNSEFKREIIQLQHYEPNLPNYLETYVE